MHPNPAFRQSPAQDNIAFARDRAFGIVTVNGPDGPLLAHVPFLLSDDGTSADLHLVRSNPISRALATPQPAVIAVSGPDGYVSPDWYDTADQVPTWNYIAVHLRGTLALLPQDDMHDMLDRQSNAFESRLLPKQPWTLDKLPDDARLRLYRQIVPCRLTITAVDGTWKLNQNKTAAARLGAAQAMATSPVGQETAALAALMRHPPPG